MVENNLVRLRPIDVAKVIFTGKDRGPGSVTVECSIDESLEPIRGDTYRGKVMNEDRAVVATFRLDAGS